MNPRLEGYAAAVLGDVAGGERDGLAADLAAVDVLFDVNAPLRAAITDVALPGQVRRAVVEELLTGKVSPAARRLAGFGAGAVRGQEIPAAMAWLAQRARQTAEGRATPEAALGHRSSRERVGGFATAVFEELSVAELEDVEDELFRFTRTVAANPALRSALGDRELPAEVRRAVVDDLLSGKVRPATRRLAGYAVTGGRARDVVGTLDWLVERTAEARGWRVARVRAGQEVGAEERRKLSDTLSRLAGAPVELQVTVDPNLLAGVDVEIGDLRLDATARGRLERLREHVAVGGWQDRGFGSSARGAHHEGTDHEGAGGAEGRRPEGAA